jgi:hypothetical protein
MPQHWLLALRLNTANAQANSAARARYEIAQSAQVASVPPVRTVPIEYFDREPMVRIAVGNASFRCVLDTGASDLVIPMSIIEKAANYGAFLDEDLKVIGAGRARLAGGATIKTVNIVLREVTVGPWILHNVPVTVPPAGSCLLGMSVLRAFGHPTIDFAGHRLVLEDQSRGSLASNLVSHLADALWWQHISRAVLACVSFFSPTTSWQASCARGYLLRRACCRRSGADASRPAEVPEHLVIRYSEWNSAGTICLNMTTSF